MFSFFVFLIPTTLWLFLMRDFICGTVPVNMDTLTIYAVSKLYFNNVLNGTVPLWDPYVALGAPFYAIAICNLFSPFALLVPLTALVTGDYYAGFILYCLAFFLVGCAGFYLLVKELVKDRNIAYVGFVMLMFSSLGASMFTQLTFLELFTPAVWFFYFACRFIRSPSKLAFAGAAWAMMSVLIAYIPFYFMTLLLFVGVAVLCVRPRLFQEITAAKCAFVKKNKMLTLACIAGLLVCCAPIWAYRQLDLTGEVVSPGRHCTYTNAQQCVERTLEHRGGMSFEEITKSGTLSERMDPLSLFKHLDKFSYGSDALIFLPVTVLFLLALALPYPCRRLTAALGIIFVLVLLTCLGDRTPLYGWLYKAVPWMKFYRNLFFFAAYLLPLAVLASCVQLKDILQQSPASGRDLKLRVSWVVLVTAAAVWFLGRLDDVMPSMYISIIAAGAVVAAHMLAAGRLKPVVTAGLFVAATVLVPVEAMSHYAANAVIFKATLAKEWARPAFSFSRPEVPPASDERIFRFVPYENFYATMHMKDTVPNVGYPQSTTRYAFMLEQAKGAPLVRQIGRHKLYLILSDGRAEPVLPGDGRVNVKSFDPNRLDLDLNLGSPARLIYTDNYISFWKVFIDGKEAFLHRDWDAFKGVDVPAGAHEVQFFYQPPGGQWVYGLVTVVLVLMGICVGVLWRLRL